MGLNEVVDERLDTHPITTGCVLMLLTMTMLFLSSVVVLIGIYVMLVLSTA